MRDPFSLLVITRLSFRVTYVIDSPPIPMLNQAQSVNGNKPRQVPRAVCRQGKELTSDGV